MKEFCKCGHSKKAHLITSDINMCCCVWQVSEEKEKIQWLKENLKIPVFVAKKNNGVEYIEQ